MHLSMSEILVVLVVALLVIKPERLPEVAGILGKGLKRVRRWVTEIKNEVESPSLGKYSYHEDKKE